MMEIEVGDIFSNYNTVYGVKALFKVVNIETLNLVTCVVYMENSIVGKSVEYRNTLLKMQKLTPLEKELM